VSMSKDKDKIIELLEQIVADKDKQIARLSKSCNALADEIQRWKDWKASSEARHAKGREKTKTSLKPNKQKVGFLKKHKLKE
jgi:hypothetical protein